MLHSDIGTRKDISNYRIQTEKSDLNAANILMNAGEYRGANNRAYYAIYRAIMAVHTFKRYCTNTI